MSLSAAAPRLAALLLGVACVVWSAAPLGHQGLLRITLTISAIAVVAAGLRLALADVPTPDGPYLAWYMDSAMLALAAVRAAAWEEIAVVTVVWAEIQHPFRPWHTAALGAGLTAYLLVTHIAESGAQPGRVLRRQWKLLAIGACLLALGAGLAMLPAADAGAGAALLRILAAIAVVAAAALVLPA